MSEFIKINRDITSHWLWQDAERLKWWLDLLLMAATEDKKVIHDSHVFTLKKGQVVASLRDLQRRWKTTFKGVRIFISKLESENLISRMFIDKHTTKIEICNYGTYIENGQRAQPRAQPTDCKSDKNSIQRAQPRAQLTEKPQKKPQENGQRAQLRAQPTDCKSDENSIQRAQPRAQSTETPETPSNPPRARVISYNSNNNIYYKPTSLRKIGMSDRTSDAPVSPFSIKKFVEFWNSEIEAHKSVMPKIKAIGEGSKRRVQLTARVKEYGKDSVAEMVRKAVVSDFLNGKSRNGWIATLDWLIKPSNFPKVLEGNYDNRKQHSLSSSASSDYEARRLEEQQRLEQQRKQKAAAVTHEQYTRWKREHAEEYLRQQEQLAKGAKLTTDSS